ncbi:uncharacterized protein HKW66_Vig0096690 [Vigna angularis]|uniref:DUF4378 domain-containing protein n=2 Tax=Phaseolus angularis TaxID=3914 RepID=A0A8T0KKH2_PHAAN|nr:uncharacterized protein LOC108330807 isoform X1 [Vigna angularis]KAG2400477.1 uncharacterized protein HKW66_Vig0096690 [Vigna angularis]BAT77938.1 hypothetical protein VIGAN_02055400 [Vigna angularis var. angularis]
MASPKPKSGKILAEFLKEQQDPFILDLYLLEKGYSTKNKKREPLFQFSKVLTTLHKKLVFHNPSCILIRESHIINQHVLHTVPRQPESSDQTIEDTDRFSSSTATNSTVYLSCSDSDEDGTAVSPQKNKALFFPNNCHASNTGIPQSQQTTDNEKHEQRCLEGDPVPECGSRTVSVTEEATLKQDVSGMEERRSSCCVFVPKKMTEDSVLSVALWSSLIQSAKREKCSKELGELLGANANVCHVLKSKTLLHKLKQVVFYCVREISVNVWRKECREHQCLKESRGREELGKIICVRTRELGGNERNRIASLLSLDEWSEFKPQVRHICVEIADALLERLTMDIVAEMV